MSAPGEAVAVVGISCQFPGGPDTEGFWRTIVQGRDAISPVPPSRFDVNALYDPDPHAAGKLNTRWGGFIEDAEMFDAEFFGIAPREAKSVSPQQRLVVTHTWRALEDAAIDPQALAGSRTGVFCGVSSYDYWECLRDNPANIDAYAITGSSYSVTANRVSYLFDFRGPSVAVDTACSSSLVAAHMAHRSLLERECDCAIVAGVQFILSPWIAIGLSQGGFMAPDGRCKPFDASANGYVRGEGVGVVVLKRLADAVSAADRIHAVILGSAVNQDGRSNGLTAPNPVSQQDVLRSAYTAAAIDPSSVGYVETHGTGTKLGDPIELNALGAVVGQGRAPDDECVVGSVKGNIGHLEAAAGIAGLIKSVLCLRHRMLPPTVHYREPNPLADLARLKLRVLAQAEPWKDALHRRVAGVSSFGFGGTNAHLVLAEAPPAPATKAVDVCMCLPVSTKKRAALARLMQDYAVALRALKDEEAADFCFTAATGRARLDHRAVVHGRNRLDLIAKLETLNRDPASLGPAAVRRPKAAFLFGGQGSQCPGMGAWLWRHQPLFRDVAERCIGALKPDEARALRTFFESGQSEKLEETIQAQPALFVLQCGLADLWRSWGITPSIVLGHSLGEFAAAYVAGVFGLEDGMSLVAERARAMHELAPEGAMAAAAADTEAVSRIIASLGCGLEIAAQNSRANTVVAGAPAQISAFAERCGTGGIRCQRLPVRRAFHTSSMAAAARAFGAFARTRCYQASRIPFISSMSGAVTSVTDWGGYWETQVVSRVRFDEALRTLATHPMNALLELSGRPVLLPMFDDGVLPAARRIPSLRANVRDDEALAAAGCALFECGFSIEWSRFPGACGRRRVEVPGQPLDPRRFWFEEPIAATAGAASIAAPHRYGRFEPVATAPDAPEATWQADICLQAMPWLAGHCIGGECVAPGSFFLTLISRAIASSGQGGRLIRNVRFHRPLVLRFDVVDQLQMKLRRAGTSEGTFEIWSRPASASGNPVLHVTGELAVAA